MLRELEAKAMYWPPFDLAALQLLRRMFASPLPGFDQFIAEVHQFGIEASRLADDEGVAMQERRTAALENVRAELVAAIDARTGRSGRRLRTGARP
jgi:hypothetical protein